MITQKEFEKLTEQNDTILTKEEEYSVFEYYNKNKTTENKNRIALKNLKLIYNPARDYTRFGSELVDLQQEAFLGLLHAIDKFDYTKNIKFSTYAYTWFDSYLQKCTIDDRIIHIPFNTVWKIEKMKRIIQEYKDEHDSNPPDKYLLNKMGIDKAELGLLRQYETRTNTLSMDYTYNSGEENTTFHNFVIDEEQMMEKFIDKIVYSEAVDYILSCLSRDQYELLTRRYGLKGNQVHTIKELAEIYSTNETVITMKLKKIHRELRNNKKVKKLYNDIF